MRSSLRQISHILEPSIIFLNFAGLCSRTACGPRSLERKFRDLREPVKEPCMSVSFSMNIWIVSSAYIAYPRPSGIPPEKTTL